MVTNWDYSLETEANRLLHCGHQIASGFYKINNFLVLPYKPGQKYTENEVSLPVLPYQKIPRFWARVAKISTKALPLDAPQDLVSQTVKVLSESKMIKPNYTQVQKLWTRYQNAILTEIYKLIPGKVNCITGITIWPTSFGTNCSFSLLKEKRGQIYVYLREGSSITSIVEAILSSITRPDVFNNLNGLWQESEIIVDWILNHTQLGMFLKKIDPEDKPYTIQKTRKKQEASFIAASEKFLKEIGAPETDHAFSLNNGEVLVRQNPVEKLTPREKEILRLLVAKHPNIATVDEVADIIFKNNDDDFSLYAIAKTIQRLRDKLEENGVSGSFIQTKRGEGYLLVN